MHYYSHSIGDYRRDTMHLTLLEHGIYRQLIDSYYLSESPIPLETEVVFRRLLVRSEEETKAVISILKEFFKETEIGWIHTRCNEEIEAFHSKQARARQNGKAGGRPKKTKVVILENPDITQTKANHKPITNNQYIPPNPKGGNGTDEVTVSASDGFDEFWEAFPDRNKGKKTSCQRAWVQWRFKMPPIPELMDALENHKRSQKWAEGFIDSPLNWIEEQNWLLKLEPARKQAQRMVSNPSIAKPESMEDAQSWFDDTFPHLAGTNWQEWPDNVKKDYLKTQIVKIGSVNRL